MRRLLVLLIVLLAASATAADVIVHPFASQDPVVGVALAERVAAALGGVDVLGPEVAPTLVPPVVVPGGFVNPLALLRGGSYDRTAVVLMAGAVGVPVVVSGSVAFETDSVRLDLVAAVDGAVRSATVRAPGLDLDTLLRRATLVVATWAGARPLPPRPLDLRGPDADAARARALIGAGYLLEAWESLDGLVDPHPTDARLRDDLRHALDATGAGDPALAAMASLGASDPAVATAAFARWRAAGGPPVADVWAGSWARSLEDADAAARAFSAAADAYPFGRAALAADRAAAGDDAGARQALLEIGDVADPAALLAGALAANALGDATAEDDFLAALGRAAPFMTYPFERRSFLAFDRDDALTAASVLVVAVDLDPTSDLYWTNLGWAWYLLGFVDRSEAASLRALELDPAQYIARYNLGLARVVTGRLPAALDDYREALRYDPDVDSEAIADLVAAEQDHPRALGVPFALGFLLENAGEREAAATAYERYVRRASAAAAGDADAERVPEARARVAVLRAPLPPIEITGSPRLTLGRRGPVVDEARPGDPLTVSFEVMTPGEALPRRLRLSVELLGSDGGVLAADEAVVDVPTGAIGYVVDVLTLELPVDLPAGAYGMAVTATGDGIEARADRELAVDGSADRLRRLIGRGLVLTSLDNGQALIGVRDLAFAAEAVWARLVEELRGSAALAEEAMPAATSGRFAGRSGGAVFEEATAADVQDFLDHLLDSGARYSTFAFADAFAQWVLDGAP
jgi:tetratricopeptide (TPR) repeat protein